VEELRHRSPHESLRAQRRHVSETG
jgi:hypothetical protein